MCRAEIIRTFAVGFDEGALPKRSKRCLGLGVGVKADEGKNIYLRRRRKRRSVEELLLLLLCEVCAASSSAD